MAAGAVSLVFSAQTMNAESAIQSLAATLDVLIQKSVESVRIFQDFERALAKLGAVLRSTGNAAGFSQSQLEDFANEIQQMTTLTEQQAIEAMSRLATFTNITGEEFKKATVLAADLSTLIGSSLPQAALQLGRALNDPRGGLDLLTQSGIAFETELKELIKDLDEMGLSARARSLMLAELQARFGGVAQEIARTPTGKFQKMLVEINELMRDFGGFLLNEFEPVIDTLRELIDQLSSPAFKDMAAPFRELADVMGILARNLTWYVIQYKEFRAAQQGQQDSLGGLPGPGRVGAGILTLGGSEIARYIAGIPEREGLTGARAESERLEREIAKTLKKLAEAAELERDAEIEAAKAIRDRIQAERDAVKEAENLRKVQADMAKEVRDHARKIEEARKAFRAGVVEEIMTDNEKLQRRFNEILRHFLAGGFTQEEANLIGRWIEQQRPEERQREQFKAQFVGLEEMNKRIQAAAASGQDPRQRELEKQTRQDAERNTLLQEFRDKTFELLTFVAGGARAG